MAGTLSSTPLVKGAEGLFYSSDLGVKERWDGFLELGGSTQSAVAQLLFFFANDLPLKLCHYEYN